TAGRDHRPGWPAARSRPAALWPDRHAGACRRGRRHAARRPDTAGLAGTVRSAKGSVVIRVVLVDDQALVRTGLARILAAEDGFEVVGECADGAEAVAAVPQLGPDLVLMDVRMPRMDGIEATRLLRGGADPPPVLALTT